jgi:acetyltransferase
MRQIHEFAASEVAGYEDQLAELLCNAVNGGASVGFLPPLTLDDARAYWAGVASAIASGGRILIGAFEEGVLLGTVQLGLETRANGSHRGEIMKLMVHESARGKGAGRQLMSHIENVAKKLGRTLLVLDTRTGCNDAAEAMYYKLGYRKAGVIPRYARSAGGALHDTIFMYRELE